MKRKTLGILLLATAVLAAAVLLTRRDPPEGERGEGRGALLFPGLPADGPFRITITGGRETVHLVRGADGWRVTERFDYPADFNRIAALVDQIAGLRVERRFAAAPEVLGRLGLNSPDAGGETGVHIRLQVAEGQPDAAAFRVGKRREAGAAGGGQYLRVDQSESVSLVDREFEPLDRTSGADWIAKQVLNVATEEVQSVVCRRHPEGAVRYRLQRPARGEKPVMEGVAPPAGHRVLDYRLEQLFEALSPLKVSDVAGPAGQKGVPPEGALRFEFQLFDGARYTVIPGEVAAGDGELRSLRISADGAPPGEAERLAAWVYLVAPWQAELFVAETANFFEKDV